MILDAIKNGLIRANEKGWDKTYWVFDIHGTIFKPTWSTGLSGEFYPYAKATLQYLSSREDIYMILWTCSPPDKVIAYARLFDDNGIFFDAFGENPEVTNTEYGNYENKMYMNVLFEDKAGFDPEREWRDVFDWFGLKQDAEGNWIPND